ncbi:4-hydroxy-tetrahydrodipicolinate reductase [Candidatus Mesenet endosymbiont of Agriotes lineatus]|uniref:4-hydroxy-tetrahydrodipicolinate reductase n=1 Tax=Candidatus Mesenet endosymbiont of Agriotes lineatus TaxID=3077948 RepID=UPI0030CB1516
MKTKIGIVGCLGRMGRFIVSELRNCGNVEMSGGVAKSGNEKIGLDIGLALNIGLEIGVKVTDSIFNLFKSSDVVIDFTNKECLLQCLEVAYDLEKPLVSGTTGIDGIDLKEYSKKAPILWSANMSIGVNLLCKLVQDASKSLGQDYDVEIWEMHHSLKKDSPSGTAIALGEAAAEGLNVDFKINHYFNSDSNFRKKGSIGFAVSRGGGIIGDHKVMFTNEGEQIELSHRGINRNIYAKGAIKAALWLAQKPAGLYSMKNVLEI